MTTLPVENNEVTPAVPEEIWVDVPGYPAYEISNLSVVRAKERTIIGRNMYGEYTAVYAPRIMNQPLNSKGYRRVALSCPGETYRYVLVHKLMALAFLPNTPEDINGRSSKYTVDHIDGDKLNNLPENLKWITRRENSQKHYGTLIDPDMVRKIRRDFDTGMFTYADLCRKYNLTSGNCYHICNRNTWTDVEDDES